MLTVGNDSYVSLEDANNIIAAAFISTDSALQNWNNLSDNDKEVLLRQSCRSIDNLKYSGRRQNTNQVLEFPRIQQSYAGITSRLFIGQFYDNGLIDDSSYGFGGLNLAREAQCINAVYAGLYNDLTTEQIGVNIQGLTSKRAGPISETYSRSSKYSSVTNEDAMKGIYTSKVYSLLTPWLVSSRFSI